MKEYQGYVDKRFNKVRDVFVRNFQAYGEVGASLCIYYQDEVVVDIWGGISNQETNQPWEKDTLCLVFSSTKGATATLANILIQEGKFTPETPVAEIWPDFGCEGKENIPVKWLLSHKAGLPYVEEKFYLDDVIKWFPVVNALAKQRPIWEPGTKHGYHAITFGWLVGEVIRRATKTTTFTEAFNNYIRDKLDLDFYIGLPPDLESRVAKLELIKAPKDEEALKIYNAVLGPETLTGKALTSPSPALADLDVWNSKDLHSAAIPSAAGITNARSLAKLYACTYRDISGKRLLSDEQIKLASTLQTHGSDQILFFDTSFGLGYMLSSAFSLYAHKGSFGHDGAGGSLGFCDPVNEISFGYVMNKMLAGINGDPRSRALVNATYEVLGLPTPGQLFAESR